jgi:hypothetical protein
MLHVSGHPLLLLSVGVLVWLSRHGLRDIWLFLVLYDNERAALHIHTFIKNLICPKCS